MRREGAEGCYHEPGQGRSVPGQRGSSGRAGGQTGLDLLMGRDVVGQRGAKDGSKEFEQLGVRRMENS